MTRLPPTKSPQFDKLGRRLYEMRVRGVNIYSLEASQELQLGPLNYSQIRRLYERGMQLDEQERPARAIERYVDAVRLLAAVEKMAGSGQQRGVASRLPRLQRHVATAEAYARRLNPGWSPAIEILRREVDEWYFGETWP